jgi:tetratricopeptide (TPR) repeat protein
MSSQAQPQGQFFGLRIFTSPRIDPRIAGGVFAPTAFWGNQIALGEFYQVTHVGGSDYMTPYIAIVLAIWIQTDRTAPSASTLQQAHAEYLSGHLAAAERLFVDALGQLPQTDERVRAKVLGDLGNVYTDQEEFLKAERAYSQSLLLLKHFLDSSNTALMLQNLGVLYSLQGRNDEALRFVGQALQLVQSAVTNDPSITAQVLTGFGIVHYRRNNTRQAEESFNQALEIIRTSNVPFNTGELLGYLGAVYLRQHKFKQAEDVLNRALQIKEAHKGLFDLDLTPELNTIGAVYIATGKFTEAELQYERLLKILESRRSDFAPAIARVLHSLSNIYSKLGRQSESDSALSEAAMIALDNLNKDSEMAQIAEEYSRLLKSRGQKQEAASLLEQVKRARVMADLVVHTVP